MRILATDIIDATDLDDLLELQQSKARHDFGEASQIPSFRALLERIEECIPEKPIWDAPSYYRVETRVKAHSKHYDGCTLTGLPNHMSWCRYSAVSVLTEKFEGGTLRFHNPILELTDDLYCNAMIYSSGADNDPQLHEREAHNGDRVALLLFIATEVSDAVH